MKNPIPSIKSFIYLYRDYSKISTTTFPNSFQNPPLPPHRCHRLSEIRTADPLDSRPLCFRLIANSRIPRPRNERACFSGAGSPLDR